jgi:hypothetical protein
MIFGTVALRPRRLPRPFVLDDRGGPRFGWFHHAVPILVRQWCYSRSPPASCAQEAAVLGGGL